MTSQDVEHRTIARAALTEFWGTTDGGEEALARCESRLRNLVLTHDAMNTLRSQLPQLPQSGHGAIMERVEKVDRLLEQMMGGG